MAVNSIQVEQVKKVLIPKYFYEIIIPNMEGYYSDYEVNFEGHPVAKCPLHAEDTPSFRWYEETNTFYCFGCGKGGDIITLHRLFVQNLTGKQPPFEETINFLENYFLKGMHDAVATDVHIEEEQPKSSPAEVIVLSNYVKRLEEQLQRETNLGLDKKKIIYEAIDTAVLLSSTNRVNAIDAMNYIKGIVRKAIPHP